VSDVGTNAIHPGATPSNGSSNGSTAIAGPSSRSSPPSATTAARDSGGALASVALGLGRHDEDWLAVQADHWSTEPGRPPDKQASLIVQRQIKAKARELAGESPSALVMTLALSAACTWYEMSFRLASLPIGRAMHPDPRDICYERALKRWLAAARTLAQVQKLNITVQVNVSQGPMQVVNSPR
jgi:hypothetical protein